MFFKPKTKCTHDRIRPDSDAGYCPDCGKYIENKWYLTRCSCCGVKRKTVVKQDKIQPYHRFCPNCGNEEFYVQEVRSIDFIDINYAILIKEEARKKTLQSNQYWVERESEPIKLLGLIQNIIKSEHCF